MIHLFKYAWSYIDMHHEIQDRKGKKYHYISENIRTGEGKWKKIRLYLGKGDLSEKRLSGLINKKREEIEKKVEVFKKKNDILLALLSNKEVSELEAVRKKWKSWVDKADSTLWQKYYEWFVTQFTYDTSAIEGSSVTLQETGLILFDRIVPEGRTIKEIRETENHKDAFDFMLHYNEDITKRSVLKLHKLLMHNVLWKYSGKFRDVQVIIRGAKLMPPPSSQIEKQFKQLMRWYGSNKKKYHPIVLAAYFHVVFESIHPFRDGNGRVGRLLLNFILRKNGFPMIDIKTEDRFRYYKCLEEAQINNDLKPLTDLVTTCLEKSVEVM